MACGVGRHFAMRELGIPGPSHEVPVMACSPRDGRRTPAGPCTSPMLQGLGDGTVPPRTVASCNYPEMGPLSQSTRKSRIVSRLSLLLPLHLLCFEIKLHHRLGGMTCNRRGTLGNCRMSPRFRFLMGPGDGNSHLPVSRSLRPLSKAEHERPVTLSAGHDARVRVLLDEKLKCTRTGDTPESKERQRGVAHGVADGVRGSEFWPLIPEWPRAGHLIALDPAFSHLCCVCPARVRDQVASFAHACRTRRISSAVC